jgi:sugar phosphate isomerase/epimerase
VSTHLFHGQKLSRDHLVEIAAHGFEAVEVFATRTHFDYHSDQAIADLQEWLADTRLELHSVHAPITGSYVGGKWGPALSLASADKDKRAQAVAEAEHALHIARRMPMRALVAHLGIPRDQQPSPGDNSRDGARRSVEELQPKAEALDVELALEVIPNELSRAGALVHLVEDDLEDIDVGVCFDSGHANIDGDVVEAIEIVSGHLVTTHLHDNNGRQDQHLVPGDGTIDWAGVMLALQKVGYDGALILELAAHGSPKETLERAQQARQRLEKMLAS